MLNRIYTDGIPNVSAFYLKFEPAFQSLRMHYLRKNSKQIYGANKFVFYAVDDGLFAILSRCKQGISDMLTKSLNLCNYPSSLSVSVGAEKMGKLKTTIH